LFNVGIGKSQEMPPTIDVTKVKISPDQPCPLSAGLDLTLEYTSSAAIPAAHWDLRYVVDYASKRHVIELGSMPCMVVAGSNTTTFSTPGIDFSSIKRSVLLNVGLLLATLVDTSSSEEAIQVSFVTNVDASGPDKSLMRHIFNPLD
jgi:hypothetical protein